MLDTMRALSKSLVSKLLMALLVVSFAVWGIGDMVKGGGENYAAKVGNSTISIGEFQLQRRAMEQQLEASGMKGLPPGQLEFAVMRQLLQQKLTLLAMQDVGLFVNEELLGKTISTMPEFKGITGKFSAERFKESLAAQRMPEKVFLSQIKRDIAGQFMVDSLDMGDATPPASVLALNMLIDGETRDAVLITVPARDVTDEKNDEALKQFYEENKLALYMQPETRTLEYVVLDQSDVESLLDAGITEDMLADRIKQSPELNKGLARIKLRGEMREQTMHDFSNTIEDELAAGKTIGEAFAKAGVKATPRSMTLNQDEAKALSDDISSTVATQGFTLGEGEISRLVSSQKGTLLMVSAKKVTTTSPKPFEEVKADVKSRLGKQLARDAAQAKAVTVKEALAKAPNWQAVTSEQNLSSRVVSRVARPSALPAADDSVPPALRKAIFERKFGEVAGPLALPNGDQILAVITASHAPEVSPTSIRPSKAVAASVERLVQNIQGLAYNAFTDAHPIKVNEGLLRAAAEPAAQ